MLLGTVSAFGGCSELRATSPLRCLSIFAQPKGHDAPGEEPCFVHFDFLYMVKSSVPPLVHARFTHVLAYTREPYVARPPSVNFAA